MTYREYVKGFKNRYGDILSISTDFNKASATLRIFITAGPPVWWQNETQKRTGFMSISKRGMHIFAEEWLDTESFDLFSVIVHELDNDAKTLDFGIDLYVGKPGKSYEEAY